MLSVFQAASNMSASYALRKAAILQSAAGASLAVPGNVNTGTGVVTHRVRLTSTMEASEIIRETDDVSVPEVGVVHVPVVKGDFLALPHSVQEFIAEYVSDETQSICSKIIY